MKTAQEVIKIDPARVKVFVHRDRNQEEFQRSVEDTRRRGQIEPGEVRDLRDRPREERRRPDGGLYDYGLVVGEGRLLRAKALGQKFRAFVVERSEVQTVGRFLSAIAPVAAILRSEKLLTMLPEQTREELERFAEIYV